MGLGKTVQVITFLLAVFDKEGSKVDKERELRIGVRKVQSVLVVCHSYVLCNWEEELNTSHETLLCGHKIKDINPGVTHAMNSLSCPMRIGLAGWKATKAELALARLKQAKLNTLLPPPLPPAHDEVHSTGSN